MSKSIVIGGISSLERSAPALTWNVNGSLSLLGTKSKRVDGIYVPSALTPTKATMALKKAGTAGTLTVDIRKHTQLNAPIKTILPIYAATSSSYAAAVGTVATQSIAAHTSAISTQSITRAKATLSIQSITQIQGTNQWKYNFSGSLLDSDYAVGKSVLVASATNAGNNGTFTIVEVNSGNFPSIVVTNASGVAQSTATGTLDLQLFSYNFSSAVSSDYVAGDNFLASSHTTGTNNGSFTIYKLNQSGNNIWVYNSTGATQAGVAGTANTYLWRYNYAAAVNSTYLVVGEKALMASHTTAANNGNFTIRGVNVSGNNIVVYNVSGVAQAGVAGTATSNRWTITVASDPTSYILVGSNVRVSGNAITNNNGLFTALIVSSGSITIYNELGATSATSLTINSTKYVITLNSTIVSLGITTSSKIEMAKIPASAGAISVFEETDLKTGYDVLAIGQGYSVLGTVQAASDYTVTIQDDSALAADWNIYSSTPVVNGYISVESKSVLPSVISNTASPIGLYENQMVAQVLSFSGTIAAGSWLGLWVLSNYTSGNAQDLAVTLY